MVYTLSYQMYKYEHGLSVAEQRAADVRAGEAAAARAAALAAARAVVQGGLRLRPGRALRSRPGVRSAPAAADAASGSVRVLSGVR
jgi:hypothetical protein